MLFSLASNWAEFLTFPLKFKGLGAVAQPAFLTPEGRHRGLGLQSCQEPGLCWKGHFGVTMASESSLSPS